MSLDVYLTVEQTLLRMARVPVRVDGTIKNLTIEEWRELHPDRNPCVLPMETTNEVYTANITHNLGKMAAEAGIYEHLWRPDEIGITKAAELIEPLRAGLVILRADPERFKAFNPANGWGSYDILVRFVNNYIQACADNPDAGVSVWR